MYFIIVRRILWIIARMSIDRWTVLNIDHWHAYIRENLIIYTSDTFVTWYVTSVGIQQRLFVFTCVREYSLLRGSSIIDMNKTSVFGRLRILFVVFLGICQTCPENTQPFVLEINIAQRCACVHMLQTHWYYYSRNTIDQISVNIIFLYIIENLKHCQIPFIKLQIE